MCGKITSVKGQDTLASPPVDWRQTLRGHFVIACAFWTVLIVGSAVFGVHNARESAHKIAGDTALANFNKDLAIRSMMSDMGGVYADATKIVPNPYLPALPEKDLTTPSGKHLTLVNPAYFLRLLMDRYGEVYGIHGRITSLKPLNPNNAPDAWEKENLERFEQGKRESITAIAERNGVPYLRMLRPFITDKSCLKCHGHQGYQEGDVRGGIGVSVPLKPYLDEVAGAEARLLVTHFLIWLAGVAAFALFFKRQGLLFAVIDRQRRDLATAKAAAERANQAKSEFLSSMSHDIRAPMNAILGLTEVISSTSLNPEQRSLLNRVNSAGRALGTLINDVLDVSKIESGEIELFVKAFSPSAVAQETISIFENMAKEKRVDLELACEIGIPEAVLGDDGRFQQILVNLIGNALKFTDRGSVRVTLRYIGQALELRVADSGCGISQEDQSRIFEAFVQAGDDRKRRVGSGLGLTICRKLAHRMGGDIRVESKVGQGSVFTVTLPLPPAAPGEVSPAEHKDAVSGDEHPFRTVLSIDDSEDNRVLIQFALKGLDIELAQAPGGAEALSLLENREFDLILLDIQMPVMDGYEVLARIRELEKARGRKPATIVALTADALKEDVDRMLASGFDLHMAKPIQVRRLKSLVAKGIR